MVQGESLRRESMALAAVKYSTTWLVLPWPRGSRLAGSRWSWRRYSTPPHGWSYLGPWGVVEKGVDGLGGSEVLHHEAYLGPGGVVEQGVDGLGGGEELHHVAVLTLAHGESLRRESMVLAAVKYSTTWLFLPWPRGSRWEGSRWPWRRWSTPRRGCARTWSSSPARSSCSHVSTTRGPPWHTQTMKRGPPWHTQTMTRGPPWHTQSLPTKRVRSTVIRLRSRSFSIF